MQHLADLILENPSAFRDRVHEDFYTRILEARQIFGFRMAETHVDMAPTLAWYLQHCSEDGVPNAQARERIAFLGRDHRRHGFPPAAFAAFSQSLMAGLKPFELSDAASRAAQRAFTELAALLSGAAEEADLAGTPPAHQAQVVDVVRPNRELALVRLESAMPIDFAPGQYFPVTSKFLPGTWRHLTPAAPSTSTGQLEFHVRGVGEASRTLARAQVGDTWTLGAPRGEFAHTLGDGEYPVFLCFGTGWAAVRTWLLAQVEAAIETPADIECSLYSVAPSPGHHYDTTVLDNLAALNPDMRVHLLVDAAEDPLLLGAPEPDVYCEPTNDPVMTMLSREDAHGSRFILVGPEARVTDAAAKLRTAGITAVEEHPWGRTSHSF